MAWEYRYSYYIEVKGKGQVTGYSRWKFHWLVIFFKVEGHWKIIWCFKFFYWYTMSYIVYQHPIPLKFFKLKIPKKKKLKKKVKMDKWLENSITIIELLWIKNIILYYFKKNYIIKFWLLKFMEVKWCVFFLIKINNKTNNSSIVLYKGKWNT